MANRCHRCGRICTEAEVNDYSTCWECRDELEPIRRTYDADELGIDQEEDD